MLTKRKGVWWLAGDYFLLHCVALLLDVSRLSFFAHVDPYVRKISSLLFLSLPRLVVVAEHLGVILAGQVDFGR